MGGTSCTVTRVVTVNAGPSAITGADSVCVGSTLSLGDGTPGGTWTSSTPASGTISAAGVVTGIAAGTTTISYAVGGGCPSVLTVTVNGLPAAIGGPAAVCVNGTITETDATAGGTWSITPPGTASVVGGTGSVTGLSAGAATVTYTLSTGCRATRPVTVNGLPAAIGGTPVICVGLTTALTDGTPGGTWSNSTPPVGTISTGGVFTGLSSGLDTVTYTLATGCSISVVVTVNSVPSAITGAGSICVGATLTLTDPVSGGSWTSGNPAVATVGSSTGLVTGASPGTATIAYASGGCGTSVTVTVVAAPAAMTGPSAVCVGSTITKSDVSPGGSWSCGSPWLASIGSSSGVITGLASGTVIVSYALGTGCAVVAPVIIDPISQILGTPEVCVGQQTLLADTTLGGSWSSSAPAIATVSSAGVVTGYSAGVTTISYLLATGCYATQVVTVDPVPLPLSAATFAVCAGNSITVYDASPGGSWSSSSAAATVTGGTVTGVTAGIAVISYTYGTGCAATHAVTVNPDPGTVSGSLVVCTGGTVTLTDVPAGGIWTSGAPAVATIGTTSGIVTGMTTGTATISYQLMTGCLALATVTVNPALGAITGTPQVCVGSVTALTAPGSGTGSWSSSSTVIAPVDMSGNVTGMSTGVALITYSEGSGCIALLPVTVNPVPAAISGSSTVCQGQTTVLTDITPGGSWTSSDPTIATIAPTGPGTGLVTGIATGTVTISYTLASTGCAAARSEEVNPSPAAITGSLQVCVGNSTVLGDATPGGSWSSSNPAVAGVTGGTVTGMSPGVATISYTVGGCSATAVVTVSIPPVAVSGSGTVCQGYTTVYTDGVPGGTWTSSNTTIATAGSSSGVITGMTPGVATITYSVGAGCARSKDITVNPTPVAVTGPLTVCATQSISLSDATPGGLWSSAAAATATVSSAGVVTGVSAGVAAISYSFGTGCAAWASITVNPMPSVITGNMSVCLGGTSTLHDSVGGGMWISSNLPVATVGSSSGVVSGVSLGTSTIIYILPAGCAQSTLVHVYPLPQVFTVTGGGSYCAGGNGEHIGLSGSAVGVNYMLYRGVTATGAFAGTGSVMDFGLQTVTGTYTVIGTSTATTCSIAMTGSAVIDTIATVAPSVSLHAAPGDTVCTGTAVTVSPTAVNGGTAPAFQWSVNGTNVATTGTYTFIPANGDIVKVVMTSNATCPLPLTASNMVTLHVDAYARPSVALSASPGDTVCQGTLVTVTALPADGGSAPVYTWLKDGVVTGGTGNSYAFVPAGNDAEYCILQSNYPCRLGCNDTSAVLVLTTDTPQVPQVTIAASPGTLISQGQLLTLTATVVNGGATPTYQWLKNGFPVAGATNAVYASDSFSHVTEDSVTCLVTSSGLCPATGYKWVYIQVAPTGVKTVSGAGDIVLIPNPNKGEFMIKGSLGSSLDEQVSLEITDVLGQQVYKDNLEARGGRLSNHIQLSAGLANGMYLITLRYSQGTLVFHMVMEQ